VDWNGFTSQCGLLSVIDAGIVRRPWKNAKNRHIYLHIFTLHTLGYAV
jgi:hypothetical protein